jgi:paraquat-inducible protein B
MVGVEHAIRGRTDHHGHTFDSAEGLQAGQSQLKYKDITFGTIKTLTLSRDLNHVVATIATTHEAEPLLTEGTVFWVVRPRLFAGNISGLGTLVSGTYISMLAPEIAGKARREFAGQEDPPILSAHAPGHIFLLKSRRIGSITVGSPIFYRDLNVGEVLGWDTGDLANSVTIHAFVRAPYDRYVRAETRFWDASGLSISLGASGVDVKMESLRALLFGGVAFETPAADALSPVAAEKHGFPLFANREEANSASYTREIAGVSYFTGSVRGLASGSEVTMHGLKIGSVTDVRLTKDPAKGTIVAAVRYEVQPERIVGIGQRDYKTDKEAVAALLDRGLRARLETASLITGQQTVGMEFVADAPAVPVTMEGTDFVVPSTESGGFSALASSATDVLNKVNTIPFAEIGSNLNGVLASVNKATDDAQLKRAIDQVSASLVVAKKTLNSVNQLAASVDTGYGNDTKFHRDLDRLLVQADEAVRGIRALTDLLAQHPEALIKGRSQ